MKKPFILCKYTNVEIEYMIYTKHKKKKSSIINYTYIFFLKIKYI